MRRVRSSRALVCVLGAYWCGGGGGGSQSGTGVGFSVEKAQTEQMPVVAPSTGGAVKMVVVEDSKRGWAEGVRTLVAALFVGEAVQWDLSKLRPAGSRLVTMGGRASGPDPLNDLFHFTVATFKGAEGRRLTPLECHDMMCKVRVVSSAGVISG
jgi:ribonucleoside-triphosphate reductase